MPRPYPPSRTHPGYVWSPPHFENVHAFRALADKQSESRHVSQFRRRASNKDRKKLLIGSEGWLLPGEFLEVAPRGELKEHHLAHVKDIGRLTAAGGARAVPADGGSSLPFPGGSGIILPAQ